MIVEVKNLLEERILIFWSRSHSNKYEVAGLSRQMFLFILFSFTFSLPKFALISHDIWASLKKKRLLPVWSPSDKLTLYSTVSPWTVDRRKAKTFIMLARIHILGWHHWGDRFLQQCHESKVRKCVAWFSDKIPGDLNTNGFLV